MADDTRIVGSFSDRQQATVAVHALRAAGIADSQIGVITRDNRTGLPNDPTGTRWEEGTGIGAAAGGATGLGLGLAVAAGMLTPIGPVIAGGALVALLASAGAGATVGTVAGGLVGLGIPEGEQAYYKRELDAGRALVVVDSDRPAEVRVILTQSGGSLRAPADTVAT